MTMTCCRPLADLHCTDYPASLFGSAFRLRVEPTVFLWARQLSADYAGGPWDFFALSNGGFYMAPQTLGAFDATCENGFEGELSADAFGIAACLYAFSHLSCAKTEAFAERCAEQYRLLRQHMLEHREVRSISAAID